MSKVDYASFGNRIVIDDTHPSVCPDCNCRHQRLHCGDRTGQDSRPEEALNLMKSDAHSLGKWRVSGALPHINAWSDAFGITEGNAMYLPVENRVPIW